jgi:hypothetical protein
VPESKRAKDSAVRKEMAEQLAAFQELRDDADRAITGGVAARGESVVGLSAASVVKGLNEDGRGEGGAARA